MTSEAQELLKLIDGHIEVINISLPDESVSNYSQGYHLGMRSIRWLVYDFLNSLRPAGEPSPLTEEELKDYMPDMDEVVKSALTVGQGVARYTRDELGNLVIKYVEPEEYIKPVEDAGTKDFSL